MSTTAEVEYLSLFRGAFESMPCAALVIARSSSRVVAANARARSFFRDAGLDVDWSPGCSLTDLIVGSTTPVDRLVEDLRIAAGNTAIPLPFPIGPGAAPPSGPRSDRVVGRVVALPGPDGRPRAWLLTFGHDASSAAQFRALNEQVKRSSDEMARARRDKRRLRDEYETLERFSYAMAHDLKAPLRHIVTAAMVMDDKLGDELPDEVRSLLDIMGRSADRGRSLVDALLRHASARSGSIEREPLDLQTVVDGAVDELRLELDEIDATVTIRRPLPTVLADRALVRLLIDNLLGNAIKYRSPDRPLSIEISSGDSGDPMILEVDDNGTGFDPARARELFEPFQRLTTDGIEGSGLGLATCRTICERHDWMIRADGRPDEGARFQVLDVARSTACDRGDGPHEDDR